MDQKIESTADALEYLYTLSLDASGFRFRGQARFEWTLQPSVYRLENSLRYQAVFHEKHLLEAKPETPQPPVTHTKFDLEWLMLCQHYGIPTRLLDWSADLLVALYFACADESRDDTDGAMFVCDQSDYPMYGAYDDHATKTQELAFVSTSVVNPRMRMQSGSFMLWGNASLNEGSTESYDLWEYQSAQEVPPRLDKIRVPKHAKDRIRKELQDIYGITRGVLYLDGGYLETRFASQFENLKETVRLKTLYITDAGRLSASERKQANSMFGNCENMFGNCVSIGKKA